jgi:glycosyltransferase involved in cell wall biosynthesis
MSAIRVTHLITDLDVGGAETMLAKLVSSMDAGRFRTKVVSMIPPGVIGARLVQQGIEVHSLGMRRGLPHPLAIWRLLRLLHDEKPDVLQTWLYHADLLGLIASRLARVPHLVWNLRCSDMDLREYSRLSAAMPRLLGWLSRGPDLIIVNSHAGRETHEQLGYRARQWQVIPNGFDTDRFHPDGQAHARLCTRLQWAQDSFVVCLPARFDPMKDHANFLAAATRFAQDCGRARFLLVGRGADSNNESLAAAVDRTGCGRKIALLGERHDMPELLAGSDLVTLSSAFGEGSPNVIGEAMACGAPVVATDVGDAARLIGGAGLIVRPRDAEALSAAWRRVFELGPQDRAQLGAKGRQRIVERYAMPTIIARYAALYEDLARPLS